MVELEIFNIINIIIDINEIVKNIWCLSTADILIIFIVYVTVTDMQIFIDLMIDKSKSKKAKDDEKKEQNKKDCIQWLNYMRDASRSRYIKNKDKKWSYYGRQDLNNNNWIRLLKYLNINIKK